MQHKTRKRPVDLGRAGRGSCSIPCRRTCIPCSHLEFGRIWGDQERHEFVVAEKALARLQKVAEDRRTVGWQSSQMFLTCRRAVDSVLPGQLTYMCLAPHYRMFLNPRIVPHCRVFKLAVSACVPRHHGSPGSHPLRRLRSSLSRPSPCLTFTTDHRPNTTNHGLCVSRCTS